MAKILDGKKLADDIRSRIAADVAGLVKKGIKPGLAVVLIGNDPASRSYVKMKRAQCEKTGIASFDHDLPSSVTEEELLALISKLNKDNSVHGILVQLPLPEHINEDRVAQAIDPVKDVDCFHPENAGRFFSGNARFVPCTPAGIMELIDFSGIDPAGKRAVVVGRSNIVGKPAAFLLLTRNATVTICHSKTRDLANEVGRADIVVAAIGKPKMIKGEWIKPGACVIDVGINRTSDGKLVGDVDFDSAEKRAGAITPVPGGVGPMTIAMLLKNTVNAAKESVNAKKNPSL